MALVANLASSLFHLVAQVRVLFLKGVKLLGKLVDFLVLGGFDVVKVSYKELLFIVVYLEISEGELEVSQAVLSSLGGGL